MWLYRVTRASRPLFGLVWKMRLTGAVDAIPRTGPAIVVANHSSFVDPWFLGPFLFPRPIHFLITRQWYDKSAVSRFVFRSYSTIPMENEPHKTIDVAVAALDAGRVVGIFPEGRISCDGNIQRFRTGVCYLAARSGVAVVPVGLRGAFESLPRNRRLPTRGKITLTVGEPMTFPGSPVQGAPGRNEVREFRDRLSTEVRRLAGQAEKVSGTFSRDGAAAVPGSLLKPAD